MRSLPQRWKEKLYPITEYIILSLFNPFTVWEQKTSLISSFLVLREGRKKARLHQTRHKAKAMFSLDFRSKHHFKVHWWLLLCDLFWIFPRKQIITTRNFLNLECYTNSIQKLLANQQLHRREAKETGIHQGKRQVNIIIIPFHQEMFNYQILIKPKWILQS